MPEIGQTISHYRITEKLGQGAMGEVFLAHDTSLDRKVALKFLPDIFSGDPERLARFEREARLLAALNHANIATIYGLEQADGKRFLAMELVEGETLAQQIERGPLPVEEALQVCRQIAEGLEAAHEKGVIHRDLKPANVKITPDGKAKILDFGLAKAFQSDSPAADASKSPTLTNQMTQAGVILGTAAYMSPEQAKGKAVDIRTDIWAFGCILYECLTGKRAFEGETVTETLAALLRAEPDWTAVPPAVSPRLTELLRRCLRKDPKERMHHIADVRIGLQETGMQAAAAETDPIATAGSRAWMIATIGLSCLLLAGGIAGYLFLGKIAAPQGPVIRFRLDVAPATQLGGGWELEQSVGMKRPSRTAFAMTPDGRKLIYSGRANDGKTRLYLRTLDQMDAKEIEDTEGARFPFLNPDGTWVGFFADERIKKVSLAGGKSLPICNETRLPFGASWGAGDVIVYSCDRCLWKVSAAGGSKPEPLTSPNAEKGEYSHDLPHFLPSGRALLLSCQTSPDRWDNPRIEVLMMGTGERRLLIEEGADAQYVRTGHLLFALRGALYAVPFDVDRLKINGSPVSIQDDVMQAMNAMSGYLNTFAAQFCASDSGTFVYVPGGAYPDPERTVDWLDRGGSPHPLIPAVGPYYGSRLSPDGKRIAYNTQGKRYNILTYDIERGTTTQLTSSGYNMWPLWTPDGTKVTYVSLDRKGARILQVSADSSGQPERLWEAESPTELNPGSWSCDGKSLAIVRRLPPASLDIVVYHPTEKKVEEFLTAPYNESYPAFSPDGRWLAYASDERGHYQVHVKAYPGPGETYPISTEWGIAPSWNPDGSELFYVDESMSGTKLKVVDIQTMPAFHAGKPRDLLDYGQHRFYGAPLRAYDTDGKRFFAVNFKQQVEAPPVTRLNIVVNWFNELKRLVPPK